MAKRTAERTFVEIAARGEKDDSASNEVSEGISSPVPEEEGHLSTNNGERRLISGERRKEKFSCLFLFCVVCDWLKNAWTQAEGLCPSSFRSDLGETAGEDSSSWEVRGGNRIVGDARRGQRSCSSASEVRQSRLARIERIDRSWEVQWIDCLSSRRSSSLRRRNGEHLSNDQSSLSLRTRISTALESSPRWWKGIQRRETTLWTDTSTGFERNETNRGRSGSHLRTTITLFCSMKQAFCVFVWRRESVYCLDWFHERSEFLWINSSVVIDIGVFEHRSCRIVLIALSRHIRRSDANIGTESVAMRFVGIRCSGVFLVLDGIRGETSVSDIKANRIGDRLRSSTAGKRTLRLTTKQKCSDRRERREKNTYCQSLNVLLS